MRFGLVFGCGALLSLAGCVYGPPPGQVVSTAPPGISGNAGANCHDVNQTIMVGGQPQQGVLTVCQQPDGSWQAMQASNQAQLQAQSQPSYAPYYYGYSPYYPDYAYYDPFFFGGFGFGSAFFFEDGGRFGRGRFGGGRFGGRHFGGGHFGGGHFGGGHSGGGHSGGHG
jgi:hypothetical protein